MTSSLRWKRVEGVARCARLALIATTLASQQVFAAEFAVTDLGTLGGGFSFSSGINDAGEVVGDSYTGPGIIRPFVYTGGIMKNLGTLGGPLSLTFGFGINFSGQAVGEFDKGPGTGTRGYLFANGTMIDVGTLGAPGMFPGTRARGVNAAGKVVGDSGTVNSRSHAFIYDGARMTDLGTLPGGTSSRAVAINDPGQIVGDSDTASHGTHAFLLSGGVMTDLGTLGGTNSSAAAINADGVVVGDSDTAGDASHHAFLYRNGTMTDLGTLGGKTSFASGINSLGQVVGRSEIAGDTVQHGFLYTGGSMLDLNDLVPPGVTISVAAGINEAGQIAAVGKMSSSAEDHALLLTPKLLNRLAYAWANNPTAASYTPQAPYAFNSTGGAIHITRQTTGVYDVAFARLPGWGNNGLSSAVSATAYGSSTIACSVVSYASSPNTAVATIGCFDVIAQRSADSRFTVLVVGNQSVPTPSAFAFSGGSPPVPPMNPAWSWTSSNSAQSVTHNPAVGDYNVLLGTGNTPKSAKLVTASGGGARCNDAQGISGGLRVRCYDTSAAPSDQRFWVVQVAGGVGNRRVGFALANLATIASYTPNASTSFNSSGGAITATRPSVGHYAINFAGLQKLAGHTENVQVTAVGPSLTTCNVVSWNNSSDGLTVRVECRNGAGGFRDSLYTVLVLE